MFKAKSIKLNEYIQIVKNEYVTVQIIPNKSNRNNNTDAIASIINKMYLKTNDMVKRENKKLIISTQMKASYYIHINICIIYLFGSFFPGDLQTVQFLCRWRRDPTRPRPRNFWVAASN